MRSARLGFRRAAFAAALLLGASGAATAQQASNQLEEVVVTAEKRSENIQQVPIAISAFTNQALQDKNITDIHALSNLTANVNLDSGAPFSGDSSVLSASIRGIGQDDFAFNLDPGVGVYVDGIYISRTFGANQNLLDVDRVEILKGPQGTLFGQNTIGGAISIVTRTPGDQFTFEGEATGGSYNRRDFAATADIPITDQLLSTLTISSQQRDGYQIQVPYNSPTPYVEDTPSGYNGGTRNEGANGGQDQQTIRAKLLYKYSDDLTFTLTADWTHEDQPSTPNTVLATYPQIPGAIAALYNGCVTGVLAKALPILCGTPRNGRPPLDSGIPYLLISPQTTQTGNIDTTYADGPSFARYDSYGGGFTIDYKLTDDLTVKSITGYRSIPDWDIGIDLDGAADHGQFQNVTDKQGQHQTSEELQLAGSALDGDLNFVTGFFYFNEGGYVHDFVPFDGGLLMVYDGSGNTIDTTSYAGYVHADYKLTDELGITLGGRYSFEEKDFVGSQSDENGLSYKASGCYPATASASLIGGPAGLTCQQLLGFPVAGQPYRYFPAGTNVQDFYEFTPTAGAQYHITPDLMSYFSWSKGFKAGGWTTRLSTPIANADEAAFGPEKDETYEVGLKSEWLDHRLVLNMAGFYSQYSDIQLNFQEGPSPVYRNAGDADILGAELEGHAIVGDGFSINTSVGYIDAYYTKLIPIPGISPTACEPACIFLGNKLPKTPKWKAYIGPEYDYTLGNDATLRFLVDYTHTASMFNDVYETPQLRRPETDVFNASVQYVSPDDRYEVVVGGTNITNDRYVTVGSINYGAGVVDGTYNPPAEWYMTVRVKFQGEKAPEAVTPPPPPAPVSEAPPVAPTPEKQREFQVFFDFDKSNITDAAARVIQAAADVVKSGGIAHITVTGHTDTVGTARYNQGLSERRAASVKTQLVTDGVSGGEITTVGAGKSGLLVPTADGVREPQNRRAVIELQ